MAEEGEILRVAVEYAIPTASQALNVFYFRIASGAGNDEETLDDMADWVENDWGAGWLDLAVAVAEILTVAVDVVDLAGLVVRNLGSAPIGLIGGVGGEGGVAAASAYIKADTEFPKTRGSKYIPGLGEGNIQDGLLTAESIADLVTLLLLYVNTFAGVTSSTLYEPGVPSRTMEAWVPFSGAGSFTDVPAYQRRRKPNVGS